jgi:hypothetical protein
MHELFSTGAPIVYEVIYVPLFYHWRNEHNCVNFFKIPVIVFVNELPLLEADAVQLLRAVHDEPVILLLLVLVNAFTGSIASVLWKIFINAAASILVVWQVLYTHKTSGFKTSGFKTSGFKTSGLQNVRFQNIWFQNVQFLNLINLFNKKFRNCQACIPI